MSTLIFNGLVACAFPQLRPLYVELSSPRHFVGPPCQEHSLIQASLHLCLV